MKRNLVVIRNLKYKRHEFWGKPTKIDGNLFTFIYDIPYFPACGVFPPLHLLNQFLSSGGGDGGMSPGTSWKPFDINESEYNDLIKAIEQTPISEIELYARYAYLQFCLDNSFDNINDYFDWYKAVCEKHRENWHSKLKEIGKLSS